MSDSILVSLGASRPCLAWGNEEVGEEDDDAGEPGEPRTGSDRSESVGELLKDGTSLWAGVELLSEEDEMRRCRRKGRDKLGSK